MGDVLKDIGVLPDARLEAQPETGRAITRRRLVDMLNYLNFRDGNILIHFKHSQFNNIISFKAVPQPCAGKILDCLWSDNSGIYQRLSSYSFLYFIFGDGQKMFFVKPAVLNISEQGISFELPETCHEINSRKVKRYPCNGIKVELFQNGALFNGYLIDFNAASFCIEVSVEPPQSFQWLNPESAVNIVLKNGQDVIYSGNCKIMRMTDGQKTRELVLETLSNQVSRFKPKKIRSIRNIFTPMPNIVFNHPLTGKVVNREIKDLAGSGLSVEERPDDSVLLPGMIIPKLDIMFANDFTISCKAQVIHKNVSMSEGDKVLVKCGIAFLDMDLKDQARLSSFLHHATHKKSYVNSEVDMDDLWKFFFESGFIYPEKYALIQAEKKKFKDTYVKLYVNAPYIARHFIYQDKGTIQGHMSTIHFHKNAWLIHQHSASRTGGRAGIVVLDQIGRYVNDFCCLDATQMNFVMCYFRYDNRFPHRVFGGFVRSLNNPKGASLDSFSYFHFARTSEFSGLSETDIVLVETQPEDLLALKSLYEFQSGGLMISALDLEPDAMNIDNLSKEYKELGLKRERYLFTLKRNGLVQAVIMINISDLGLNLSNLTNCITVFVLDSDNLTKDMLYSALSMLFQYYDLDKIPVLLYPIGYAEKQSLPYEKMYTLWILSMQALDDYLRHIENLFHSHNEGYI